MNWIRYSYSGPRARNTMPLSMGAPQVHASGLLGGVAAEPGRLYLEAGRVTGMAHALKGTKVTSQGRL